MSSDSLTRMSEGKEAPVDREKAILDSAMSLIGEHGISGVSMRSVAKRANVSLGLVNYYFSGKTALVAAVLRRVEEEDAVLVRSNPAETPEANLRASLRRTLSNTYLTTEYLSLRLQLWALAQVDPMFAQINIEAQHRYREGLTKLIHDARPDLSMSEAERRAMDIDIIQNGIWLTSLLGVTRSDIKRCADMCEKISFAE